jgi:hypothetical protein
VCDVLAVICSFVSVTVNSPMRVTIMHYTCSLAIAEDHAGYGQHIRNDSATHGLRALPSALRNDKLFREWREIVHPNVMDGISLRWHPACTFEDAHALRARPAAREAASHVLNGRVE